jgi:ribosomal protein L12E/L44/L45/RPP1/RPP2
MSNFADTYEEDESIYDESTSEQNPVRARMKQLEKENREAKKLVAELQTAAKELSFAKAGIDVTDPRFKYFVKGYDGEPTPEAIRQAAEEAQLITPQATPQDTDKAAWQQTNRIAAGAETASSGPSWRKRINDASSQEELLAIFAEAQAQGVDLGEI